MSRKLVIVNLSLLCVLISADTVPKKAFLNGTLSALQTCFCVFWIHMENRAVVRWFK